MSTEYGVCKYYQIQHVIRYQGAPPRPTSHAPWAIHGTTAIATLLIHVHVHVHLRHAARHRSTVGTRSCIPSSTPLTWGKKVLETIGRLPLLDRLEDSRFLPQGTTHHGGAAIGLLEGASLSHNYHNLPSSNQLTPPRSSSSSKHSTARHGQPTSATHAKPTNHSAPTISAQSKTPTSSSPR